MITGDPMTFAIDWELMPGFTFPVMNQVIGYIDFWIAGCKLGNVHPDALLDWVCNEVEDNVAHWPKVAPKEFLGRSALEVLSTVRDARFNPYGMPELSEKARFALGRRLSWLILCNSYGFDDYLIVVVPGRSTDRLVACKHLVKRNYSLKVKPNDIWQTDLRKGQILKIFRRFRTDFRAAARTRNRLLRGRKGVKVFRLLPYPESAETRTS